MQSNSSEEGNTVTKNPQLNGVNYSFWKKQMMIFIKSQDIELWKVIVKGPKVPKGKDGMTKKKIDYDDENWKHNQTNTKAMQLIFWALTLEETNRVSFCKSAKKL